MNRNNRSTSFRSSLLAAAVAGLVLASAALARPPREAAVDVAEPLSEAPWLTPVLAPGAHDLLLLEDAGLLIAGCSTDEAGGELRVLQLDDNGAVRDTEPQRLPLPRVAKFKENWVQSPFRLAAHPRLPLIYVWQDVYSTTRGDVPPAALVHAEMDRLLIYEIKAGKLEPRWSGLRGELFRVGNGGGSISVDADANRFYPGNMLIPGSTQPALGWVELGDDGMPTTDKDDAPIVKVYPAADGIPLHQAEAVIPIHEHTVLLSLHRRVVTWNIEQAPGEFVAMHLTGEGQWIMMTAHPGKPLLYLRHRRVGGDMHRVQHAQGQLTMIPQRLHLKGAHFISGPIVVTPKDSPEKLLVGGPGRVYFAELDEQGRFTGEAGQVMVPNRSVYAIAASVRHGRAYVAVEALP